LFAISNTSRFLLTACNPNKYTLICISERVDRIFKIKASSLEGSLLPSTKKIITSASSIAILA